MREPRAFRLATNGADLQLYEWPGAEPAAFFVHATGFHARCWDQVVANLPGQRCIAVDMRGHGLSAKPPPPYPWANFGEDVAGLLRALGLRDAIGVGHSKGGFAVTWAAAEVPGAFRALLLIDPVILAQEAYGMARGTGEHFAAKRRNAWASPEEMVTRFASRSPFDRWQPAVLRDYCRYGLVPDAAGDGYILACPPEIEAAAYASSAGSLAIYERIPKVGVPVRVLRAPQVDGGPAANMSGSPTWPGLAAAFPHGEDMLLPDFTHFIPMEDPAFVASQIAELG